MTGRTFASLLLEQYGYHPWLECKANTKLYNALRKEIRPVGVGFTVIAACGLDNFTFFSF